MDKEPDTGTQRNQAERIWRISWDTAREPNTSEYFLDSEAFDAFALPGILRRIKLLQEFPTCDYTKSNDVDTEKIEALNSNQNAESVNANSPRSPKRKNKKTKTTEKRKDEETEVLYSSLTAFKQKQYLHLVRVFGSGVYTNLTSEEKAQIENLALLHEQVVKEQQTTNQYLKQTSNNRKHIYCTLNPEAGRFIQERLRAKLESAIQMYPQFYNIDRVLPLVSAVKDLKVTTMLMTENLHTQGTPYSCYHKELSKQNAFLPLVFDEMIKRFPINKGDHPSQQVISRDSIALSLAEKHSCHIACSLSGLRNLLSGLISPFDQNWDIPLEVIGGNSQTTLLFDKPLAQSQTCSRERSSLYHKYAAKLRFAKLRNRNRPKTKLRYRAQPEIDSDDIFSTNEDICALETSGSIHVLRSESKSSSKESPESPDKAVINLPTEENLGKLNETDSSLQVETVNLPLEETNILIKETSKGESATVTEEHIKGVVSDMVNYVSDHVSDTDIDSDTMVIDEGVDDEKCESTNIEEEILETQDSGNKNISDGIQEIEMEGEIPNPNTAESKKEGEPKEQPFPELSDASLTINYSVLVLGDIRLLVRHKTDAENYGVPMSIFPKMQYIPDWGCEEISAKDLVEEWVTLLVKPNSVVVRVHVDATTSKVLMIQELENIGQLLSGCNANKFNSSRFLDQLYQTLKLLTSVKVGKYLLTHHSRESVAHLYQHSQKRGGFDLHGELHQRLLNVNNGNIQNNSIPFLPLDPEVTLPSMQGCRVPGLFPPKPIEQFQPKGKRGKRKKRGNK